MGKMPSDMAGRFERGVRLGLEERARGFPAQCGGIFNKGPGVRVKSRSNDEDLGQQTLAPLNP